MHWLWVALVGLVVGVLAKLIMPGKDPADLSQPYSSVSGDQLSEPGSVGPSDGIRRDSLPVLSCQYSER